MVWGTDWRVVCVTMLDGWRHQLIDACAKLDLRVQGMERGATKFTLYLETTRPPAQVERELRTQLQFEGWMTVEEEA
jgi:hypothetical protein